MYHGQSLRQGLIDHGKDMFFQASKLMYRSMEHCKDNLPKTYVLKIIMHYHCNGCIKKINDGVKEIALSEAVERTDLVAETAEVIVVGRMDPEKLCCLLHELTQKHVKIETERTVSEGETAASQETKNRFGQATSGLFASDTPEENPVTPVTPSAPPIPEAWRSQTVPSQRCAYRWSLPLPGALGVWAASDIEGTMAVYELCLIQQHSQRTLLHSVVTFALC